ncbi:hypothetical protein Droror1_Dr00028324 [Drosera rotundifolia]
MVVRKAAAAQFEERQTEWVYSRPVVVMDMLWNLRFVVVAAVVLGLSWDEKPGVPGVLEQLSGQTPFFFQRYDPSTGVYGMDFYVVLERPGYRVGRYCRCKSRVGIQHKVVVPSPKHSSEQHSSHRWKLKAEESLLQCHRN